MNGMGRAAAQRSWPGDRRLIALLSLGGFAVMYLPVYWIAMAPLWQTDEQAHGALALMVAGWLFWMKRDALLGSMGGSAPAAGWSALLVGSGVYVVGRAFDIALLQAFSQIFVIMGVILLLGGAAMLRSVWFPLCYLIFVVPMPGLLVDTLTGPLKQWISTLVELVLHAAGYPMARSGVMLSIGQYQLLVADACSGLNSMIALAALGTLFMHLRGRSSLMHNAVMLLSILPIAFVANVIRVMILVLVTYHFGDEMGQGYLHGAAGITLMLASLAMLYGVDALLAFLGTRFGGGSRQG